MKRLEEEKREKKKNMRRTKLTKENWEGEFDNKLIDWNSPRFIQSSHPVQEIKKFVNQLLEDVNEEK